MLRRYKIFSILMAILFIAGQVVAQTYVGSSTCKLCHPGVYNDYINTGHPYKLIKISGAAPTFPAGTSPGVPNPPSDKTWNDISYLIGGFGWKARFMDQEGYVLTGDANRQYNLENTDLGLAANWSGYEAATAPRKPYDCGECHTTGWVKTGEAGPHQDNKAGIYGTWAEPGITCEACHGPGSAHVGAPSANKPSKAEKCGTCHSRGDVNQIDASNGLIRHHEQYEDLLASAHKSFPCGSCHEPHKSTKYKMGGYKGVDQTCKMCHANVEIKVAAKKSFDCSSCHMPFAAKSALSITVNYDGGSVPKGDIRTHIFRVKSDANWNMFTDDGKFVRVDDKGEAHISVAYACLSCHSTKNIAWASEYADAIHKEASDVSMPLAQGEAPRTFALKQNYPNPFNPTTTIPFDIKESALVEMRLFNAAGQQVALLLNERLPAGQYQVNFSADGLPSGVYLYTLKANDFMTSKKMLLVK